MRDLEIRGAGNLLGTATKRAHLGRRLRTVLPAAGERPSVDLKHLPPEVSIDVDVNLPGARLLARRLRGRHAVQDRPLSSAVANRRCRRVGAAAAELIDRFGPPPPPVERLLELAELRIDAAVWQISAIYVEEEYLVFRYGNRPRIEQLARLSGGRLRIVDDKSRIYLQDKKLADPGQILEFAKSVLRPNCPAVYNPAPQ